MNVAKKYTLQKGFSDLQRSKYCELMVILNSIG